MDTQIDPDSKNEINFSILLNIRSILNKHNDFVAYLDSQKYKFSVIGLTETWLKKENINDFPLSCYSFKGKACENKLTEAVSLHTNQSCHFRERNDLSINFHDIIASQFVELTKPYNIIVGETYRPPNDKLEQLKESYLNYFKT